MKGNNTKMSTTVFNFRLFIEALKRLRVIGLATAILALTASALVPIVVWMEGDQRYYDSYVMDTHVLCIPVACVVILAPFFFFVLFSFLQKRKESDFFHSIPYTRTCVYVSFTTAALTFVWAIQIACGLTAGVLWSMVPHLVFDMGGLFFYVLICMLATAMICSFMMLALSVSGTAGSCMLLFVLFAGFVRTVAMIFLGCLDEIALLPTNEMWNNSFFSPLWFLPLTALYYIVDMELAAEVMYSLPNILYSAVVTLAVYALAGLIYKHRKSEMAGNPAPGRRTQTLFRVMFTLLPALLIPLFLNLGEDDAGLHLVLVVVVLLVYFLYELITTKRPKNMLKAVPGLGFVAVGYIVFLLALSAYRGIVLYEEIDRDDIKTVSVESGGFSEGTYQGILLSDFRTNDSEILKMIEQQLAYSQELERRCNYTDDYWNRTTVTIRLKSGRTLKREIIFSETHSSQVLGKLRDTEAMQNVLYRLPEKHEINGGNVHIEITPYYTDYIHLDGREKVVEEFLSVFREEFSTLSAQQKDRIIAPNLNRYDWNDNEAIDLSFYGNIGSKHFVSSYRITDDLPRTRAYLITMWGKETHNYFDCWNSEWSGSAREVLTQLLNTLEDEKFTDLHEYVNISIDASPVNRPAEVKDHTYYENEFIPMKSEKLPVLIDLLLERDLLRKKNMKDGEVDITDNTYLLRLVVEGDHQKYARIYLDCKGLYDFTAEDWETIFNLLEIQNIKK